MKSLAEFADLTSCSSSRDASSTSVDPYFTLNFVERCTWWMFVECANPFTNIRHASRLTDLPPVISWAVSARRPSSRSNSRTRWLSLTWRPESRFIIHSWSQSSRARLHVYMRRVSGNLRGRRRNLSLGFFVPCLFFHFAWASFHCITCVLTTSQGNQI